MTVFLVLHCLTMLMKQHSYAFYNGHRKLPYIALLTACDVHLRFLSASFGRRLLAIRHN